MQPVKNLMILIFLCFGGMTAAQAETSKRVLMVVSGNGENDGKTKPGYEFEEFAFAYLIFKNNNIAVDVASPRGGEVVSDAFDTNTAHNRAVLDDTFIMEKVNDTMSLGDVDSSLYDAIFVVGGKGAMFDLPDNENLQAIIADIYEKEGVVTAVCHGPAALVNVKLSNGEYLVAGRSVNGFTNKEEKLFGAKWLPDYEFLLEDKLVERGGHYEFSPLMTSHVTVDGRLITGQNPASTPAIAEALVRALGQEPVKREPYRDEPTLALIAEFLSGDEGALSHYQKEPVGYNGRLIAAYGYYFSMATETESEDRQALALMEAASGAMDQPQLHLQIATSYKKLNNVARAKSILGNIIERYPDFAPARDLLAQL